MKFVIWATAGASDPTKASLPFHLAVNGSAEAGYDTALILAGDAAEIVIGDNAEKIEGVGIPPMRELLAKAKDHKLPVYIWKACAVARGATDESLAIVNGTWITPPDAAKICAEADKVLTF